MQVIVKPTDECNGACRYCSAFTAGKQTCRMSPETIEALFRFFRRYLEETPQDTVDFTWHGGEPLLLGPEFYEMLPDLEARVFGPLRSRVGHLIQSNLTLLDDRLAAALEKLLHGRPIGTSHDLTPGVRLLRNGESYDDRWLDGLRFVQRRKIRYGVILVLHRGHLAQAEKIYYFYRNLPDRPSIRINPLYSEGRAKEPGPLHITPEEYGRFLVELHGLTAADGGRGQFEPLRQYVGGGGPPKSLCCDVAGRCADTHVGVAPSGEIYNCGRFTDSNAFRCGNLFSDDSAHVLASAGKQRLRQRGDYLRRHDCAECRWWDYCHGGCPNDAYLSSGDVFAKTHWCDGLRLFFETCLDPPQSGARGPCGSGPRGRGRRGGGRGGRDAPA
jgi:uncharacterized protein